ncbi:MAG: diaminopimelate decarboxylase [Candidatus Izemoplasma sp.]|nr:diaminopimelate decarboxylase [Candidatus Izemoplasma sp.]
MEFGTQENKEGVLHIGGLSTKELVKHYGTPLYVYDESYIESRLDTFKTVFTSTQFNANIAYASKALLNKKIVKMIQSHNLYMDSVSGGELYVIKESGFDMSRVLFHGNNKSIQELSQAIAYGVGLIVVDNVSELEVLSNLAKTKDHEIHTLLRVNPGIEAHTHEYIETARLTSKFGESIFDDDMINRIMTIYKSSVNLKLDGFHCHIGSQVFGQKPFIKTIDVMSEFISRIEKAYRVTVKTLNIGGGFGVQYTTDDTPEPLDELLSELVTHAEKTFNDYALSIENVFIEPGRSIVANAGVGLYEVGYIKETYGKKDYVFVNGGMSDNIRPALYQAKYTCDIANKLNQPRNKVYTVAGKLCESGDVLVHNAKLPTPEQGDILAIYTTGAYGYSMSSHYNKMPRPAIVFVKDGQSECVVRRETYRDLFRLDQ